MTYFYIFHVLTQNISMMSVPMFMYNQFVQYYKYFEKKTMYSCFLFSCLYICLLSTLLYIQKTIHDLTFSKNETKFKLIAQGKTRHVLDGTKLGNTDFYPDIAHITFSRYISKRLHRLFLNKHPAIKYSNRITFFKKSLFYNVTSLKQYY